MSLSPTRQGLRVTPTSGSQKFSAHRHNRRRGRDGRGTRSFARGRRPRPSGPAVGLGAAGEGAGVAARRERPRRSRGARRDRRDDRDQGRSAPGRARRRTRVVDAEFKRRLLANAPAAIAELGYTSGEPEHMVAIENTSRVHNLVVCTLCSCYPWTMLGLPPVWYKSSAVPFARSHRSARRAARVRHGARRRRRDSRVGQHRRSALPRDPRTPAGHRADDRSRSSRRW